MKITSLKTIKKPYFGYEEISRALGITPRSARVSANRYVKKGLLVRVKRNLYVLAERWESLEKEEKFALANVAQVPSYISLLTAMEYYELTTQVQRDFIESVATKRTREIKVKSAVFNYVKINRKLYFGFAREKGFFIASPEKAFLDAFYLMSLKRYNFDLTAIDLDKLDKERLKKTAKKFPQKTQKMLEEYGILKKT
ncbi:MAG: type IV toxin-antitoxin system AbiEi family antitoxin domain-containing protein [Candidatus Omnitrophota bacterium]|jgi:predicted transcriptional regulator of viral defense system